MRIGLLWFTENGEETAQKLMSVSDFDFTVYDKQKQSAKEFVKENFCLDALIFISAVGIAVRLIAQNIVSKDVDPAVIVIDEKADFIIPILSGHIGGANELAIKLADKLSTTPIITTATDINDVFAVDNWSRKANCIIANIENIKHVSASLLRGEEVGLASDFPIKGELPKGISLTDNLPVGIAVSTDGNKKPFAITLNIIPKIITVGVGCRKNTSTYEFEEYLLETLKTQNIALKAVKKISSIDLKKDEECIIAFAKKYNIPFCTYSASELASVKGEFTSSEFVKRTTGVDNICERSGIIADGGELILKKQSKNGITIAIAKEKWRCEF